MLPLPTPNRAHLWGSKPMTPQQAKQEALFHSRLVQQANVEVFTVRSDVRSYWRLTSLDRFDGSIWSSNGSYGKSSGDLDDGVPVASERITFDQQFTISALAQIWLPAAYEPKAIDVAQDVRYDEVAKVLAAARAAGIDRIDLVVDPARGE